MAKKKILVAEDSSTDLLNLENILIDLDCQVISARDGEGAYNKAVSEKPDLIFMDIVMEKMDGYEAARKMAHNDTTQSIPLVFVTSKNQKADRVWAKIVGAKDFISKPYTKEQIEAQLKAHAL